VAYLRALAAAGYDGFLSIEHIKRDEAEAARDFVASKMAQALSDSNR
jgi:sugar phosphate isomerase/epimerase